MKEPTIRALMVEPGKGPKEIVLSNTLDALQKAVSIGTDYQGLIEIIPLEDDVLLLCNEEGKFNGLKPNRRVGEDILCGVFYLIGEGEDGELASLSDSSMQAYMKRFAEPECIADWEVDKVLIMRFFC